MQAKWKYVGWGAGILLLAVVARVYYGYNPQGNMYFPKCPFKLATGYDCPGCGSQRAIHHLLHLDIAAAFAQNALVPVLLPYIIVGLWFEYGGGKKRYPQWYRRLFGRRMMWVILTALLLYTLLRNVL